MNIVQERIIQVKRFIRSMEGTIYRNLNGLAFGEYYVINPNPNPQADESICRMMLLVRQHKLELKELQQ